MSIHASGGDSEAGMGPLDVAYATTKILCRAARHRCGKGAAGPLGEQRLDEARRTTGD
jgi:hypothetical protein